MLCVEVNSCERTLGQCNSNLCLNQDTAMQIDSSDDEIEKTRVGVVERPRRMGLRSSQKAR